MRELFTYILFILISFILFISCLEEYEPNLLYADPSETILYDKHYNRIGLVDTLGKIRNSSYTIIGYLDTDGKVKDEYYTKVGEIDKSHELYYYIKDSYYNKVGEVNIETGTVRNAKYDLIGYGGGNDKWKAGVIPLLFNLE